MRIHSSANCYDLTIRLSNHPLAYPIASVNRWPRWKEQRSINVKWVSNLLFAKPRLFINVPLERMPVLKMLGFILKPLLRPTYLSITKIITVFLKVSKTLSQGHDTEPALEGWTIHYFMKLNLTSAEVLDLSSQTLQESFASSLLCYLKFCLTIKSKNYKIYAKYRHL